MAVAPILSKRGAGEGDLDRRVVDRLAELSAGEPLLLAMYAEDLSTIAQTMAGVGVEALEGLFGPAFAAYFSRAFDAQEATGRQEDQEAVARPWPYSPWPWGLLRARTQWI